MWFCTQSSTGRSSYFGLCRKREQQFHRAIARAAAQAGHGGVEEIRALDDAFDGVGEGELHVVVHVHAHFLAGRPCSSRDIFSPGREPARCKTRRNCPPRKSPWPRIWPAFPALRPIRGRESVGGGHEIDRRFVALVVRVLDHVQRGGNLVDVGRHADHVQDAVLFRQNVLVIIAALGVGHDA